MNQIITRCPDGSPPCLIELSHMSGVRLKLMDWGATWLSCCVSIGDSEREVLLGCARVEDYFTQNAQNAYMGVTVGRYANRIGNSKFSHEGNEFHVTPTHGAHQLHGGPGGFDRRRWNIVEQSREHVIFGIESADGDQGFPGNLVATVCYRLMHDQRISMEYTATADRPCPVGLTNHAYFNLDGSATSIRQHALQINAHKYLPTDPDLIPLGNLCDVEGTSFDFTQSKKIAQDLLTDKQQQQVKGYDHAYLLDAECHDMTCAAARVVSSDFRLAMDLYTTKPALQFYSGNFLQGVPARQGGCYADHQGLALETQFLPDSPNHPEWPQPDCWLKAGETYKHTTLLEFRSP
jgi:aldose 1-epimerase